MKLETEYIR